jgi:hypothetical protein
MAKKRADKVITTRARDDTATKPVRLELTLADHKRLADQARKRGLSNASYARMAVLERIEADEVKGGR